MKKTFRNFLLASVALLAIGGIVSCKKGEKSETSSKKSDKVEWSDIVVEKAPFTKGVNLTLWFEAWNPGVPNLRLYDKADFENIKALGCDVIRLPIHFDMFIEDKAASHEHKNHYYDEVN